MTEDDLDSLIPDVTGLNWNDASRILESEGFSNVQTVVVESRGSWDLVLRQDPAPGTPGEPACTVTLTISGPDLGKHLPATLTDADSTDFLKRFLRIFADSHLETERDLCLLKDVFSIHRCPDEYTHIPARILATVFDLPDLASAPRPVLSAFCKLRRMNGTPSSISQAIKLISGVDCEIVENHLPFNEFRIGNGARIGVNSRICERILDTTAFTVRLNGRPDRNVIRTIHRTITSMKPAGTSWGLEFMETTNTEELITGISIN